MPWLLWLITLDPMIVLPLVPGLATSLWAWSRVRKARRRAIAAPSTAAESARALLVARGIPDVAVAKVDGAMTDQLDPWSRRVRLSSALHDSRSIAAVAVATHEVGLLAMPRWSRVRSRMISLASLGGWAARLVIAAGVLYRYNEMLQAGFAMFSAVALAALACVPIERIADRRAATAADPRLAGLPDAALAEARGATSWRIAALPLTLRLMRI